MKKYHLLNPLVLYSLWIPVVMSFLFALISAQFGKTAGYVIPYSIYLLSLLIGILVFNNKESRNFQTGISKHHFVYYGMSFIPVLATFFVAFLPTLPHITWKLFIILLPYAIVNGLMEELFWRFTYSKWFGDQLTASFIVPTIIFTCWHFALGCSHGISYHGGMPALVGGAGMMGAIWGVTMLKTKNVKVIIIAHVLVNFFAFSQLLYENWFI